jgi:hypothetical protein
MPGLPEQERAECARLSVFRKLRPARSPEKGASILVRQKLMDIFAKNASFGLQPVRLIC